MTPVCLGDVQCSRRTGASLERQCRIHAQTPLSWRARFCVQRRWRWLRGIPAPAAPSVSMWVLGLTGRDVMVRQKPTRVVQAIASGVALLSLTLSGTERQTARIEIERPLPDERFVSRERVTFKASFKGADSAARARAVWKSSVTGELGRGEAIEVGNFPAGPQEVTVSLDGVSQSVRIRAFDDLLQ